MAALLRLPAELRLQIYEPLISRRPYIIYTDEYDAIDCQPEWIQLRNLEKFDIVLATDIRRLYWHNNTFICTEAISGVPDVHTEIWLHVHVKDNVKDLSRLKFGISNRCPQGRKGRGNPVCYNVVSVDIGRRQARMSESRSRGDRCEHVEPLLRRLEDVLSRMPVIDGRRQFSERAFRQLHAVCGSYERVERVLVEIIDGEAVAGGYTANNSVDLRLSCSK